MKSACSEKPILKCQLLTDHFLNTKIVFYIKVVNWENVTKVIQ